MYDNKKQDTVLLKEPVNPTIMLHDLIDAHQRSIRSLSMTKTFQSEAVQ